MDARENALKLFNEGNSCAQAILVAYCHRVGLEQSLASKIGSGLGGGLGRKQYICGAINAGAIIIGVKHGSGKSGDVETKEKASRIVNEFISECEVELGCAQCSELLKIDLSDPDERKKAKEAGLFDRVCNNAVVKTAIILEKYI